MLIFKKWIKWWFWRPRKTSSAHPVHICVCLGLEHIICLICVMYSYSVASLACECVFVCIAYVPDSFPQMQCVYRTWGWSPSHAHAPCLPAGKIPPWCALSTAGTLPEALWGCWGQHSAPCFLEPTQKHVHTHHMNII